MDDTNNNPVDPMTPNPEETTPEVPAADPMAPAPEAPAVSPESEVPAA